MKRFVAVFDADGVFLRVTSRGSYYLHRFTLSDANETRFEQVFALSLVGKADLKDYLPALLKELGIAESPEEFLFKACAEGSEIDPEVAEFVRSLRAQGNICCLATNQERHRMAFLDSKLHVRSHFDDVFVSCELGAMKPNREFFEAVESRYNKSDLLFWDDRPENVAAAVECGWNAYLFSGSNTLRSNLRQSGMV